LSVVVPREQAVLVVYHHAANEHRARHARGKVSRDAPELQRGRHHGQHRRQDWVLLYGVDDLLVAHDAVGGGVATAEVEKVLVLDLQVPGLRDEVRLHAVGQVPDVTAEQQYGRQAEHHGDQRHQ